MIEVILFSAPWCEPCKAFKPHFNEIATEYPDIQFDVVDVAEQPKLANAYKVRSVPTVIMTRDSDYVDRVVNPATPEQLRSLIDSNHFIG